MSDETKRCSQRVFSGGRGDIGGHPCTKPYFVTAEGKDYCRIHDPAAVKSKNDENETKWKAESERNLSRFRLASAAPELLAVCESVLLIHGGSPCLDLELEARLRRAVAKAKGTA